MSQSLPLVSSRDRILAWLSDHVPSSRVQHILGVEQMAAQLAHHYGLDHIKAAQAGLMHDLAKDFKSSLLLDKAGTQGLELDWILETTPHLLHADVSAIVARDEFAVYDPEILDAIAHHTLGQPGMSPLSCVVFIADCLEPSRGDTPELQTLRALSYENLYTALWHTCDYSLKYLLDKRVLIHPRTILTRNWALEKSKDSGKGPGSGKGEKKTHLPFPNPYSPIPNPHSPNNIDVRTNSNALNL
jgi:predicted HD superfamily hydrolase involved in NAD metabolism